MAGKVEQGAGNLHPARRGATPEERMDEHLGQNQAREG